MVKNWWKLIRGWNVLFVIAIPLILHFGFLKVSENIYADAVGQMPGVNISTYVLAMGFWDAILLALSLGFIAAAGYIINDIHDQHADQINKPERRTINTVISEETGIRAFAVLSIAGMLCGAIVSYQIDQLNYLFIHAMAIALLWLYAMDFKGRLLIGNVMIGILAGLNVWMIALYDFLPSGAQLNAAQYSHFLIISGLALFAIVITIMREMVKDLEDEKGDRALGYNTIGTSMKLSYAKGIIVALGLVVLIGLGTVARAWQTDPAALWVVLVALIAPLVAFVIYSFIMKEKKHFKRAHTFLKIYMFIGLITPSIILLLNI